MNQDTNLIVRDPVFKGCTRPSMLWGVPIYPLVCVSLIVFLITAWTSILFCLILIPIILIMRVIVQHDDQQFRLLWLKIRFRSNQRNSKFWKAAAYSPFSFQKRK